MTVKKSDINHICDLSKLRIDENEISIFTKQISDILKMINELEEADTNKIKPMAHPMNMSQRLRKDEAILNNDRDLFQENAIDSEDGFYKVPKVID
ncbi:MAG: Asp-tRNA(Asn)/Glu-tRNA(Gln) amidotransferase subunit GatC [Gammaproteobacteria bacterium]|nr:Asp-tRNA(Asn)/Glu-tRNA(Gln) amidotransferase subunit GatC [Gammaproteobacteria bacterium]